MTYQDAVDHYIQETQHVRVLPGSRLYMDEYYATCGEGTCDMSGTEVRAEYRTEDGKRHDVSVGTDFGKIVQKIVAIAQRP